MMNQIQKKSLGRKAVVSLLTLLMMFTVLLVPDVRAKAENLIIGFSDQTVQTGEKLKVSVSVPAGVVATINLKYPTGLLEYESASGETSVNAGTVAMSVGEYGSQGRKTASVTFKAKAAGDAGISVSAPRAGKRDGKQVDIGAASAIVKIKGKTETVQKASDSSLASLSVSGGQLSPAFSPEVLEYSMEVDANTDSLDISASPRDGGAKVLAVEGNQSLAVGKNTVTVKVQAENGAVSTYTITVTRAAAEEKPEDVPEEKPVDEGDDTISGETENSQVSTEMETESKNWMLTHAADKPDSDYVKELESENRMIFWAFVLVTAVLLVIIVFLLLRGRKHPAEDAGEPEDLDDFEEEVPYRKQRESLQIPQDTEEEKEEEEEIPEPEIKIPEWDKREEIPGQQTINIKLPEDWDKEPEIPGQRTMNIQFPEMEKEELPELIFPKEEETEEEAEEEDDISWEEEPELEEKRKPEKKRSEKRKKGRRKKEDDDEEEDGLEFIDL